MEVMHVQLRSCHQENMCAHTAVDTKSIFNRNRPAVWLEMAAGALTHPVYMSLRDAKTCIPSLMCVSLVNHLR